MFRKGSIICVGEDWTNRPHERVIEVVQGADIHHVAGYVGNGEIVEALFKEGVVKNDISKYFDGKSACVVLEPTVGCFNDKELNFIAGEMLFQVGRPYNHMSNIAEVLPFLRRFSSKQKRRCSGVIGYAYKNYHAFLNRSFDVLRPSDIYKDAMWDNWEKFTPQVLRY